MNDLAKRILTTIRVNSIHKGTLRPSAIVLSPQAHTAVLDYREAIHMKDSPIKHIDGIPCSVDYDIDPGSFSIEFQGS